jgi:hypothetical protein
VILIFLLLLSAWPFIDLEIPMVQVTD